MATVYKNRRGKSTRINTPKLPFDMIENILSRLPVKYLLRFKSVSKSWYSLISDSNFARIHLQQSVMKSMNNTILIYLPTSNIVHRYSILKLTNQSFHLESFEFPMKSCRKELCSCEGLVLLGSKIYTKKEIWNPSSREHTVNTIYTRFVLWNPSTRSYTEFSSPYCLGKLDSVGLCYDASKDDYKVVCIYNKKLNITNPVLNYVIYSFKNNYWTKKKKTSLVGWITKGSGLFVNGVVHWVVKYGHRKYSENSVNDLSYIHEICCFDPSDGPDGKLKKLSMPRSFHIADVLDLVPLKGQLAVSQYSRNIAMLEIWTIKEYGDCNSWTKLITIENVPAGKDLQKNTFYLVKLLCLTNEGNYVLEVYKSICNPLIVIYSPKDDKFDEPFLLVSSSKMEERKNKNHDLDEEDDSDYSEERMRYYPRMCWNDSLVVPSRN